MKAPEVTYNVRSITLTNATKGKTHIYVLIQNNYDKCVLARLTKGKKGFNTCDVSVYPMMTAALDDIFGFLKNYDRNEWIYGSHLFDHEVAYRHFVSNIKQANEPSSLMRAVGMLVFSKIGIKELNVLDPNTNWLQLGVRSTHEQKPNSSHMPRLSKTAEIVTPEEREAKRKREILARYEANPDFGTW